MYISSYLNIYPVFDKSRSRMSTTRRFYFTRKFCFYLLLNKYISNISNLYNPDKNLSLASQTICDHIFIDPKSDHTFHIFWSRTWLIYFSSRMWQFSIYFWEGGVLESNVSLFPVESNRFQPQYYFPPNTEPNLKYQLEKYSENSI